MKRLGPDFLGFLPSALRFSPDDNLDQLRGWCQGERLDSYKLLGGYRLPLSSVRPGSRSPQFFKALLLLRPCSGSPEAETNGEIRTRTNR
eukprot:3714181-Amphidinium_carterae.1